MMRNGLCWDVRMIQLTQPTDAGRLLTVMVLGEEGVNACAGNEEIFGQAARKK